MPKVGSKVQAGLASIGPSCFLRVSSGLDDKQEKIAVLGSCGIITRNSCSKSRELSDTTLQQTPLGCKYQG